MYWKPRGGDANSGDDFADPGSCLLTGLLQTMVE
ncbi:hypothetical protein PC116_g26721 [Phytophthora cactorum]|nr:hypothetical protein PC116_g26721 [Phytophthora cactorum]